MKNKVQITQQGLESLKSELEELVNVKRPKVVDRLSNARLQGDLAENSDYHNAKDELDFLDGRISELEAVLQKAEVIENGSDGGDNGVSVGTTVKVATNNVETMFHIVGEWEADPAEKKISHTSPLGSALLGKKVGDMVEVEAPAGKISYKILDVN
jgi:transcription elongation factor GreA